MSSDAAAAIACGHLGPLPGGGASPRCAMSSDLLNSVGGPPEPQQPSPGEALPRRAHPRPLQQARGPTGLARGRGAAPRGLTRRLAAAARLTLGRPRQAGGGGIRVARREARGACGPQAGSWGAARPVGGPGARGRAGDGGGRAASPGRSRRAARRGGRGAGGRASASVPGCELRLPAVPSQRRRGRRRGTGHRGGRTGGMGGAPSGPGGRAGTTAASLC